MKATISIGSRTPRVDVPSLCLHESNTIEDAVVRIDRSRRVSIALVVDDHDRIINTLSDGDVRRGIMAGLKLSDTINKLLQIKARTPHPLPVTALAGTEDDALLELMQMRGVRQIPLVTPQGRAVDIVTLGDLVPDVPHALQKIIDHFGDGADFGVDIEYTREEAPLGTGGALGLMTPPTHPVLVINGDILTDIDFRAMFAFHEENAAMMTVAVRRYEVQVPYGVVECDGVKLIGLREKPDLNFFVNAGIYLLQPSVYRYIPVNKHLNMTDLIDLLVERGEAVVSFPVREYWLDIGQHADYERAQRDATNGKWR
jgi:CBS domain-containing protein